jgi:hypothetical protein
MLSFLLHFVTPQEMYSYVGILDLFCIFHVLRLRVFYIHESSQSFISQVFLSFVMFENLVYVLLS